MVGRNEPCPCGSGKKYKKCCLRTQPPAATGAAGRDSPLRRKARRGFHGYPIATVAFYGPDDTRATKVAVGIVAAEGAEADPLERWSCETGDARTDRGIEDSILAFVGEFGARTVALAEAILGCPHEEGVDYPLGETCPRCPFWADRDRWSGAGLEAPDSGIEGEARCGLCGKSGRLIRTECCGNWICDDEAEYVPFSYARNSCARNHGRFTLCGYHNVEEHAGDWRDCAECREAFETEMYVYYGTNEYNFDVLENPPKFEPTLCTGCGKRISLGEDAYSMQGDRYWCSACSARLPL